ncbi:BTB/POZ domain containing protein [Tritrichomonas foetus]|uniref:BTB/POZ domain containing protein n=1 Tax=Tritrichomonas foetus TaxID=1144522 RepID=A0A1J4JXY4_9EUKA|nr:BTB/POZ domain containing protein [Tritrichomonas foetus]|eukprot:OHT04023.1 BTB/POZ domain containing protein [Tritrichomonas foetus]
MIEQLQEYHTVLRYDFSFIIDNPSNSAKSQSESQENPKNQDNKISPEDQKTDAPLNTTVNTSTNTTSSCGFGSSFYDCFIEAGGERIPAQRLVLCGLSKEFIRPLEKVGSVIQFDDIDASTAKAFVNFSLTGRVDLSLGRVAGLLRVGRAFKIESLVSACAEFVESSLSARTVLHLLRELSFGLDSLPSLAEFAASLVEVLSNETDFSFLPPHSLNQILARARFTSDYARDDIVRRFLEATGADPSSFAEFSSSLAGAVDDTIERTAFSAVFMCSPPDPGLLRSMSGQVIASASGQLNGRDPSSVLEENPIRHWFTESDGNAWLLIEFSELYIQPTDYGIWAHGGASTLRNWCFQGSNDRQSWVILSTHRDDESVRDPFSSNIWPINTNGFFKYFRILQTGNNWAGNRWLYLMKVEIWGVACQMDLA